MKKVMLGMLLFSTCLGTSGQCGTGTTSTCPGTPVASVVLRITDPNGVVFPKANIAVAVNGAQPVVGGCSGNCDQAVVAQDTLGNFDITVGVLGYQLATKSTTVVAAADGCHPVTQNFTIVLQPDTTVDLLFGAWECTSSFGVEDLRFDSQGQIIGAILKNKSISGDGNIYVAYNGRSIKGVSGQSTVTATANEPTRTGNLYTFSTTTMSIPVGFSNATMSADFNTMVGTLNGQTVTCTRISVPDALLDP